MLEYRYRTGSPDISRPGYGSARFSSLSNMSGKVAPWHRFVYVLAVLFPTNTHLTKEGNSKNQRVVDLKWLYIVFLWRLRCWGWFIIGFGRVEGRSQTPGAALVAGCDYTRAAYGKKKNPCVSERPSGFTTLAFGCFLPATRALRVLRYLSG